jgi:hypothetical protein
MDIKRVKWLPKNRRMKTMQLWEYEIVHLTGNKDKDMIPLLDGKGKQGWELVSVAARYNTNVEDPKYLAFFKKPLE